MGPHTEIYQSPKAHKKPKDKDNPKDSDNPKDKGNDKPKDKGNDKPKVKPRVKGNDKPKDKGKGKGKGTDPDPRRYTSGLTDRTHSTRAMALRNFFIPRMGKTPPKPDFLQTASPNASTSSTGKPLFEELDEPPSRTVSSSHARPTPPPPPTSPPPPYEYSHLPRSQTPVPIPSSSYYPLINLGIAESIRRVEYEARDVEAISLRGRTSNSASTSLVHSTISFEGAGADSYSSTEFSPSLVNNATEFTFSPSTSPFLSPLRTLKFRSTNVSRAPSPISLLPVSEGPQMAPSSAPRVSMGPPLHLHWQLLSYHLARPKLFLHFDVAFPMHDIEYRQNSLYGVQRIPLSDADLDKPAADKKLSKMTIYFQRDPFEWDIHVERDEGIRVRDVFEAIYTFLNFPLTSYENSLMQPRLRAGCKEAFRLRCNLAPVHPIAQRYQGWKRVDALLHETIFRGLTQSKSGYWILHLSGAMPNIIDRKRLISNHIAADRLPLISKFDPETTASNSPPPPPVLELPDEYLPSHPNQTPNALPEYSNIDLFNLPLSAAFVHTCLDSDVMLPLWSACRICNFVWSNPILQHGTLCNVLKNIPPLIPEHSSQDYTWAFFCRFVPLCVLFDSPGRGPLPMIQLGSDRARLIDRLEADFENPRNNMSWLHGPSGTGKSVIAYTLASRCRQKLRLAGSFFFSRRHAKCRSARSVVLALAYQLGLSQPHAKEKIIATLDSDPGIISPSRDLREQFARLLVEPLEAVDWLSPSRVFVIDAIDQCQDHAPELISLLTRLLSHLADVGLHIFFTSRDDVKGVLIKRHLLPLISDISLDRTNITRDVRLFLRQSFDKIHKRHRLQCRKPWPPNEVLDRLVDRVGPHFITGSVIIKFIDSPNHDPADRMDLIYHLPLNSSSHSESSVDDFYKSIISTADDLEEAYLHLTVVVNLADTLSCSQLHNLLNRGPNQTFDMCSVLSQLSPLVHIPDGHDSAVQIFHESLCDFLSNPLRCGEQFISQAAVHRLLAYSSLSVMIEKLPDDSTLCSRLSRLATESGSVSLGAFDNVEDLSSAISSPPEPLPFLSTLGHVMQHQYTGLQADSRTKLALQYFCRTWQILQHLDLSAVDTLPAFRFLSNIRSLPVLLAFPIFLAFESPRNGETQDPSALEHDPPIEMLDAVAEIVNDVHALKEGKTGSGALDYACTHWAYHLSLAEWDDDLRSLLTSFMEQKLQQWLVKVWCLQDLETCLRMLCEVQEFFLIANPPIRFDSDAQHTTASTEAEKEAERAGAVKQSVKEEVEAVMLEGAKRIKRIAGAGKKRVDEVIAETEVERKAAENDTHKTTAAKEETETLFGVGAGSRYSILRTASHLGRKDDLPHGVSIKRGGCWTCRVRRKKCDEKQEGNSCYTCERLRIKCLGWGTSRPEWMRDKKVVKDYKAGINAQLARSAESLKSVGDDPYEDEGSHSGGDDPYEDEGSQSVGDDYDEDEGSQSVGDDYDEEEGSQSGGDDPDEEEDSQFGGDDPYEDEGSQSSHDSFFARRSKAFLARKHYSEALADADTVIKLSPSSHSGSELKDAALSGAQRSDNKAKKTFESMLSKLKLTDPPDSKIQELRRQYTEAEKAIKGVIDAHLEKAPLRLLNTSTGHLCNQDAQINAFMESTEYNELLYSSMTHVSLQMKPIKEAVAKYFSWVMLSHRWDKEEPALHHIQDKDVYELGGVAGIEKLQKFCKKAHGMGYRWAWSDTCCIDQNNAAEVQRSVNSMFVWYRQSALTIVYLSDVPPSAESGALAKSVWITRGWTVQEFLAPIIILFYHRDWSLYLNDHSPNHKESPTIMQELERSTGINARALATFNPEMRGAREKLRWASRRVTTVQEDIAYSLFGIFGVQLPVLYGEMKQSALGRLLQEIIARSGDITALEWAGKSSEFNSCLPAEITSYTAPPHTPISLSAKEMRKSVAKLDNAVDVELALKLYTLLDSLSAPRFANSRLHLPCITFSITEVKKKRGEDQETRFTYKVTTDGLQDLSIITEDKLAQFSPARPISQAFLLVCPWNRHDFGLPDFANSAQGVKENESDGLDSRSRALKLIVRLGQPFSALLLAQQRGIEYKRIASDCNIIAEVKSTTAVHDMMGVKTLEVL